MFWLCSQRRCPALLEREDGTLVAWYRSPYAPRTGGAYDSHHRTAGIAGCTRRRGGWMASRRSCTVDDAANSSDDSEPAADRGGAREAYRPGDPKASVSIKRWVG